MIGLMGGGQLGRMMIQAAHELGQRVVVLDPERDGPAGQLADDFIEAAYTDFSALETLAKRAQVFTTEFENVPAESLRFLARHGQTMPSAQAVAIAQDRIDEKRFIAGAGIDVAPHAVITRLEDFDDLSPSLFPGVLKLARLGYDGKGQVRVHGLAQARADWIEMHRAPCVLEKLLPLEREISVIAARDQHGQIEVFPVGENVHRHGILAVTQVPARISDGLIERARQAAFTLIEALDYVGVLCVEFFVLSGERLIANEMAPRPHNSGHYSIEACQTSQFAQQVRICAGLPLGSTQLVSPAVMVNVLGDSWFQASDQPIEPDWQAVQAVRGTHVHLYGKHEPRKGRKMAHVTCLGDTLEEARQRARVVAELLRVDTGSALVHV